ncbi:hypothetical protein [Aliarcobacter butzleri]|uniref:General glycosylation pathway protein n=1 Tax=Aliarcobacter butzleri TaxID=28197 RepID=A0AAW7Q017_9BACT|nr:hypothetical protein [Aliarcobacter butzleri]MDN5053199.1 hypothetical protein [Aliarcobacter butzleri]MDN5071670.1 hypothetical protein [Aliarcobacter butzleri]MDN5076266.1 hypothetical protein [Aliarcobacter butzleri]MDN5128678.1 hypothetical protein [Aliarcobacter butzleri]NUW27326.1 hypothetical protein [Aliarcobacter butzleri]
MAESKIDYLKSDELDKVFVDFNALDTIYAVDENFVQLSPIFNRDTKDGEFVNNKIKNSLKNNTYLKNECFISAPYVSSKTNKYVVTFVKKIDNKLIAMDFDFYKLLKEYNHTDLKAELFTNGVQIIYGIIGISLTIFALILIFYSLYDFMNHLLGEANNIFQSIFKSTIGLTLGLAIFDLAKNLLEHEVVFKDYTTEAHGSNTLLIKFLISIVIALAIEALMMVFKIAISDYKDILYAVYLLLGIGFLLVTMSQYNKYLIKK